MSTDAILEKIRKLLSLAGEANPSREEAALALAKAQELMLLHEIDALDLKENPAPDEFSKHFVGTPYNRAPACQKFIAWLLQNHFQVKVLYSRVFMWDGKFTHIRKIDRRQMQSIEIPEYEGMCQARWGTMLLGRKSNLLIAEYVHDFLSREFERLWKQHQQETGKPVSAKLDFYQGLYHALDVRLTVEQCRQENKVAPGCRQQFAIAKANEDQALSQYLHQECHPSAGRKGHRRESCDADSYAEGLTAGKNLNIRPAVNEARGIKQLKG